MENDKKNTPLFYVEDLGGNLFSLEGQVTFYAPQGLSITISGENALKALEEWVKNHTTSEGSLLYSLTPH